MKTTLIIYFEENHVGRPTILYLLLLNSSITKETSIFNIICKINEVSLKKYLTLIVYFEEKIFEEKTFFLKKTFLYFFFNLLTAKYRFARKKYHYLYIQGIEKRNFFPQNVVREKK